MRTSGPVIHDLKSLFKNCNRRRLIYIFALICLSPMIWVEFGMVQVHATTFDHTVPTVNNNCAQARSSPDGNPFPLCPGPFPTGGNCVWWAWEQWHLLAYDLPPNWGNAADWIVDAERTGLPIGTTPRPGSIAVFPRADGVWAFGPEGHVAFVTWVSADATTFNVTYQNYGDTTPMHSGSGYNVSIINEPRFQDGEMRFIYFPKLIDPVRFNQLPGINGNGFTQVAMANNLVNSHITLGVPPGSIDQEFNADFTGTGFTDLLLYNRQQGSLDVLTFSDKFRQTPQNNVQNNPANQSGGNSLIAHRIHLGDTVTPMNGWGSSLDIHIGDFTGIGHSEILLYDRVTGKLQLISLTPKLKIQKHVMLPGWGPGWELFTGQFDSKHSGIFMYNPFAFSNSAPAQSPNPTPTVGHKPSPTPGHKPKPSPTPTPKPDPTPCPTFGASPSLKLSPTPNPSPSPCLKSSPSPTPKPSPSPTPKPGPDPTPKPSPSPIQCPTPGASPTADIDSTSHPTLSSSPSLCPKPTPSPTPKSDPSPTPSPTAKPKPDPTPCLTPVLSPISSPGPIPTHSPTVCPTPTHTADANYEIGISTINSIPKPGHDLSGNELQDWETQGRTSNVIVFNFKKDFTINQHQQYTLWHDAWEVYVVRFANSHQDGIFLYDRVPGEARILDFNTRLVVSQYHEMHNLTGNWEIHSGNFNNSSRAQVLLYDPSSGEAQFLLFGSDMSLIAQKSISGWGLNRVLYIGHFGLPSLSIMLYNAKASQSTFVAFDSKLRVAHQYTISSWDQNSQVLVGAFLDRSHCLASHTCTNGDDILVLNRKTGKAKQYVFSFGNRFKVFDNRVQAFLRTGAASLASLSTVDATSVSLLSTLETSIHNEELY
jgi:CHAP domain